MRTEDALRQLGSERFAIVTTNPHFGRRSSIKVIGEDGDVGSEAISYERDDCWATTSNKQLNVLQHIKSLLKINGSARTATQRLWVYDLRTNLHFTLRTRPLQLADLETFVALYQPGAIADRQPTWSEANPEGRWRCFELEELLARDATRSISICSGSRTTACSIPRASAIPIGSPPRSQATCAVPSSRWRRSWRIWNLPILRPSQPSESGPA